MEIKLKDLSLMPERAHATDAGADLKSAENITIYPGEVYAVSTGVQVKIPVGYAGFVMSRSGQGKVKVSLANSVGLIDSDYRGEIKLLVKNSGKDPYVIKYQDRIGQLVIVPISLVDFEVFEGTDDVWNDTTRGEGGFGSTGA